MPDDTKHTPGPWRVGMTLVTPQTRRWTQEQWEDNDRIEKHMVFDRFTPSDGGRGRRLVASCGPSAMSDSETEANARLIAAAPEMLEALELVVGASNEDEMQDALTASHIAIAKAEGKS